MTSTSFRALAVLLLALGLLSTLRAQDAPPRIRDHAGLFLPEVVNKATEKIVRIREIYHLDVVLETVKELSAETIKRLKQARYGNREFQTLTLERAHEAGVDGIFILISVVPKYENLQVVVRPKELEASFSARDCKRVRELLQAKLKKAPNDALLDAVDEIQDLLSYNKPNEHEQASESISWKTIALIVGCVLMLWLVLALIRMKLAAGDPPEEGADSGPKDSFLAGLMGGMFGTTAGHWIHDNLFQRESAAATPTPSPAPPEEPRRVVVEGGEDAENKVNSEIV